jgi:hypothetical protein
VSGDRLGYTETYASRFTGPDGLTHQGHSSTEIRTEVIAIDGDRISDLRLEVVWYEHTLDERVLASISGTFDLIAAGPDIELRKQGATPSAVERKYFESWEPCLATEGLRSFARHRFHVGDRYSPTTVEAAAFGYTLPNAETLQFIVTKADPISLLFTVSFVMPAQTSAEPEVHVRGTLELARDHSERIDDGCCRLQAGPSAPSMRRPTCGASPQDERSTLASPSYRSITSSIGAPAGLRFSSCYQSRSMSVRAAATPVQVLDCRAIR